MKEDLQYSSAGIMPAEKLFSGKTGIVSTENIREVIDLLPCLTLVLDEDRNIVLSNKILIDSLDHTDVADVLGSNFGELIGCKSANAVAGGCRSSEECRTCGYSIAISKAVTEKSKVNRECRLTKNTSDGFVCLDLNITVSPFQLDGELHFLVFINDISSQKRREVLEETFFHDIKNTAGGILGLSSLIRETANPGSEEMLDIMHRSSKTILDEIQAQQDLLHAEEGVLEVEVLNANSCALIEDVVNIMRHHSVAVGKELLYLDKLESVDFKTDKRLATRVLINLIKNAVEAISPGMKVFVGCYLKNDEIVFEIKNNTVIPREVRSQVFQRSFSTKGVGRGIGTYSAKLLAEKYLNARVDFTSTEEDGTSFYLRFVAANLSR